MDFFSGRKELLEELADTRAFLDSLAVHRAGPAQALFE